MDTNVLTNTLQRVKYTISALLNTNVIAPEQNHCLKNANPERNNVGVTVRIKTRN